MKKSVLAVALMLASITSKAEVTRVECPAFAGVSTCYSMGNLDESPLGISLAGSSCAKPNLRSTAPIYFKDTYYFSITRPVDISLNIQPRTTNRLRISVYTPTLESDGISALFNGTLPSYTLQQLSPNNYAVTIKGVGTGVGSGICSYRADFNTTLNQ